MQKQKEITPVTCLTSLSVSSQLKISMSSHSQDICENVKTAARRCHAHEIVLSNGSSTLVPVRSQLKIFCLSPAVLNMMQIPLGYLM
jgi:hypothetical protein